MAYVLNENHAKKKSYYRRFWVKAIPSLHSTVGFRQSKTALFDWGLLRLLLNIVSRVD